jgi:hypothetical protein
METIKQGLTNETTNILDRQIKFPEGHNVAAEWTRILNEYASSAPQFQYNAEAKTPHPSLQFPMFLESACYKPDWDKMLYAMMCGAT